MIVTLNSLVFNDPTTGNGLYLDEPITGLGLPPVRTSSGNYSGRDGGYVGAQFYGSRLISLPGRIFANTTAQYEASRMAVEAALAQATVTMLITTNAGAQYLVNAYFDSLDLPITRAAQNTTFQITLIAPDPTVYDNSTGGGNSVTLTRSTGGGITWPITWPITWSGGAGATTVTNTGNVTIYPQITLNNVMSSPIITNTTTGQFFSLPSFTTSTGDVLVIDMLNRSVLLNGGSVLGFAATTSTWWPLIPGSNTISLTTGSSGDTVTGTVSWRSGYRGI